MKRREGTSRLPSAVVLIGTAVLFSGLTAAAMTVTKRGDGSPPPPTRASVTTMLETPAPARSKTSRPPKTHGRTPSATTNAPPVAAPPVGVAIPAIKVLANVDPMGLTPDGKLQVPSDFGRVGWWAGGHEPGEPGPAILEGHVDSTKGPAVFYALRQLHAGDVIQVARKDRTNVTFIVDRVASYPKDHFPSLDVYGPTDTSTLRLITCTGSFNETVHSYRDNLVVYANLRS